MLRIAIVGATGAVGRELCAVLQERQFPLRACRLLASPRSAGTTLDTPLGPREVETLTTDSLTDIDLAFFSAGAAVSREFVPHAREAGAVVIDNSSAFRDVDHVPLVVPEVNASAVADHAEVIANPNCSTIILAVALWPLHRRNRIRRAVVSTYQAASGAGARAAAELIAQTRAVLAGEAPLAEVFPVPCAFNVFSHESSVDDSGYNVEELKMTREVRQVFADDALALAPTCMRVPVLRAHTEAATLEFAEPIDVEQARAWLAAAPGVRVIDDRPANRFPTPLDASGQDDVLVGRLRMDPSVPDGRGLQLICAGDQLRKGAALNAVQIAELIRGI